MPHPTAGQPGTPSTDPDTHEVLDLGVIDDAADGDEPTGMPARAGGRRPIPRRALIAGAAVAGGLVLATRGSRAEPSDHATPTVRTPAARTPAARTPSAVATTPPPGPAVRDLGGPLLAGASGEVVALVGGGVVRIDTATGRVTRTPLPRVGNAVSLVPVRDSVLVHGGDYGPVHLVRSDGTAEPAASGLTGTGPVLPGPDLDHVWALRNPGPGAYLVLLDLRGRSTGTTVPMPLRASGPPVADGAGSALVAGIGGTYRAGVAGLRRVTTGTAIAAGPTGWLVVDCGDDGRCTGTLMTRQGGRRAVAGVLEPTSPAGDPGALAGTLAPDGRSAALHVEDRGRVRLVVLDLATGRRTPTGLVRDAGPVPDPPIWTPDGARLLTIDPTGRIVVADARDGTLQPLLPGSAAAAPPARRLAVRWRQG